MSEFYSTQSYIGCNIVMSRKTRWAVSYNSTCVSLIAFMIAELLELSQSLCVAYVYFLEQAPRGSFPMGPTHPTAVELLCITIHVIQNLYALLYIWGHKNRGENIST